MNGPVKSESSRDHYARLVEEKGRELNLRWTTVKAYRGHLLRYMEWLQRNRVRVEEWPSEKKVGAYLQKLSVHDRVSPTTRKQAFCALLFFYKQIRQVELATVEKLNAVPKPKTDKRLPAILDGDQALHLISLIEDSAWTPFRFMALLLYGCGLRISELHELRYKDVSVKHSILVIRNTKGRADRRVGLPCSLSAAMERQLKRVELTWQQDQERGLSASMPGLDGLRRKSPNLPFTLGWQYVFSQQTPCKNPLAWPGEEDCLYRHHLCAKLLQRAVHQAAQKCQLDGMLTPHVFRHIFASQLRWNGAQLETIQRILGHKNVETTMIYVHERTTEMHSPLDAAVEQRTLRQSPRPALALPFATA